MFILRGVALVLSTLGFGTVSLIVSFFEKSGLRQARIARTWARSLLWIGGINLTVEGVDRIAHDGVYVIVPNHLSYYDTPVLLAALPLRFRFLAKRGLFSIPLLGTHLSRAGHIPVDLDDPRAGIRTMNAAATAIRDKAISVVVFPEGGRSRDGHMGEFKDGASYIGIKSGTTVVLTALCGTSE